MINLLSSRLSIIDVPVIVVRSGPPARPSGRTHNDRQTTYEHGFTIKNELITNRFVVKR